MELTKEMASHIPLLLKIFHQTEGDVLELGAGAFSTPLLHWLCAESDRNLTTAESDPEWIAFAEQFEDQTHRILGGEYADLPLEKAWGLVFIDHFPLERRGVDLLRLADYADYLIVHDANLVYAQEMNLADADGLFKYRRAYEKHYPYAGIFSNRKNPDTLNL